MAKHKTTNSQAMTADPAIGAVTAVGVSLPATGNPKRTVQRVPEAGPLTDAVLQEATSVSEIHRRRTGTPQMDQATRFKATIARAFIEREEETSEYTCNPIPLWQAYRVARGSGQPIPESVLAYFDGVAQALTGNNAPTSPTTFLKAFGVATRGGPSKTKQAITAARDLDLESRIDALRRFAKAYPKRRPDLSDMVGILLQVARDFDLSLERVQAIHRQVTEFDRRQDSEPPESSSASQQPTGCLSRREPVTRAARRQKDSRRRRRANSRSS